MDKNAPEKKWYNTWWGALWALAMVEANPGRGLRIFMEMDEDFKGEKKNEEKAD